ncbi:hypothetical protein [Rodentibacter caecimuris]|uniref:hypothetical protein n=1 Tax=Rodentibacter caecimuris TaxID=1796644 RepID=UPI002248A530|nr:hypothetical protein [Rodentibacter heylii]MCX2960482.1 hypothetical protein [Rodentibacter heylii]
MSEYRSDHYICLEYQNDFKYYEGTPIGEIQFDGKHSLPWDFFSVSGLDYLLPRILYLIQSEVECLSISLLDFIVNMTMTQRIVELINQLEFSDLSILNKIIENILYETNEEIISEIGEHYLFLDLEFLASKLS